MSRRSTKFFREGKYAVEIEIELIEDDSPWSPHVAKEDIQKLDRVRLALRRGDIAAAKREAEVFELTPVG